MVLKFTSSKRGYVIMSKILNDPNLSENVRNAILNKDNNLQLKEDRKDKKRAERMTLMIIRNAKKGKTSMWRRQYKFLPFTYYVSDDVLEMINQNLHDLGVEYKVTAHWIFHGFEDAETQSEFSIYPIGDEENSKQSCDLVLLPLQ